MDSRANTNTLIIGGAGFIGLHLAQRLAAESSSPLTLLDNLSRGQKDAELEALLARPHVEFVQGDATDPDTFAQLDGLYSHVYLLAGMIGARNVQSRPALVMRTNTRIILNTVEWMAEQSSGRLLFASTSEVYAGSIELGTGQIPSTEDIPVSFTDIQHPRFTYGLTKSWGEAAVTHYAAAFGFEAVIARFHNVYGPRMGFDHVMPELMQRLHAGIEPLPVYGTEQTRAFCYVDDATRATQMLMDTPISGVPIVHVGNDREEVTMGIVLEKICDIIGRHPVFDVQSAIPGAVSRRCPDIGKLHALTGFTPAIDLDAGLARTWAWYQPVLAARATAAMETA
jgi:UDP-glucuronate decarboxylase